MPLDPKKTKNGVDLNQIDVSKLALVDKEGLVQDLGKRLKDEIKNALTEAVKSVKPDIEKMVGGAVNNSQQTQQTQQTPSANETPNGPPKNNGGDLPKTPQHKTPKIKQPASNLGGSMYSDKGKQYAEDLDELADSYHTFNIKELEAAQKRLSDVQESIRFTTFGKENALLSSATAKLQNELANEAKNRSTTLGKIGHFLDRENINAASIITGIFSDSPMVGLMTKAVMESIRNRRVAAQKQKADQLKIGDIKQHLPRPNNFQSVPQIPQASQTQSQPRPDQQQSSIKTHSTMPQPVPRQQGQLINIGDYETRRPERIPEDVLRDNAGNPVQAQEEGPMNRNRSGEPIPQKKDEPALKLAWYKAAQKALLEKAEREWEEQKKQKYPNELKDSDVFPPPLPGKSGEIYEDYGPPSQLVKLREEQKKREVLKEKEGNEPQQVHTPFLRKNAGQVVEMPHRPERIEPDVQQQAALVTRADKVEEKDPETQLHPESIRGSNNITGTPCCCPLSFGNRNNRSNPFLELRQLSKRQLEELEKISKILALQLEQAELANDAARRETKEINIGGGEGGGFGKETTTKKRSEEGGGFGEIISSLLGGMEEFNVIKMLKGIVTGGKTAKTAEEIGKVAEGAGEAGKGVKAAEEMGEIGKVAEGAGEAGKGAKAIEEAGFMGKLLGKVPVGAKLLEKAPGAAKLLRKVPGLKNLGYYLTALDVGIGTASSKDIAKRTAGLEFNNESSSEGIINKTIGNAVGAVPNYIASKFGYNGHNLKGGAGAAVGGSYAVGQALDAFTFLPRWLIGYKGNKLDADNITGNMLSGLSKLYKFSSDNDIEKDLVKAIKSGRKEDRDAAVKKWGTNFPLAGQVIDMGAANWKTPGWLPGTPEHFVDLIFHPEHAKQTPTTPTKPQDQPSTSPLPDNKPDNKTSTTEMMKSTTTPFSTALSSSSAAMNRSARLTPNNLDNQPSTTGEVAFAAMQAEKETGFPAKVIMAQFAMESSRGKNVTGDFNFFGVTGTGTGGSKMVKTREELTPEYAEKHFPDAILDPNQSGVAPGKKRYIVHRPFAVYKSIKDAVDQQVKLLSNNPRYKPAFEKYKKTKDPDQLMRDIAAAGYATDSKYGDHLVKISKSDDLVSALSKTSPVQEESKPNKTEIASSVAPIMQPPPIPQAGTRLTQASMQNADLVRTSSTTSPAPNQTVIAPSNVTSNTSVLSGVNAQNDESTYQRTMNLMYVPT